MADIKVSQLQLAPTTTQTDQFMIVQGNSNKRITLATLLGHLDAPVTVNSGVLNLNMVVNGMSPNLLCTHAQTNTVGIRTDKAEGAVLQVVGDIRVGGTKVNTQNISTIGVGATDSGGVGKKLVTVTTSANHGFVANDNVNISGASVSAINGLVRISVNGLNTFTYTINNSVVTTGLTLSSATAVRTTYYPGVFKGSFESYLIPIDEVNSVHALDASYSITGLTIPGVTQLTLANGTQGQEKYIYLKATANAGDKATINNINGLGFNRIQFQKIGDAVQLIYDGNVWVCTGANGASISTV